MSWILTRGDAAVSTTSARSRWLPRQRGQVIDLRDGAPRPVPPSSRRRRTTAALQRRAVLLDAVAVLSATVIGYVSRFSISRDGLADGQREWGMALGVAVAWIVVLALTGTYDRRFLGTGFVELKRVLVATMSLFAVVAGISYLFMLEVSRGFLLTTLALGLLFLTLSRLSLRSWLRRRRHDGLSLTRTVIIGPPMLAMPVRDSLTSDRTAGYDVVDVIPAPTGDVDAWLDQVTTRIARDDVDAVAVTQADTLTSDVVRRLAWRLEGPQVDLMVAPPLSDLAGPRLTFRPDLAVPLIHLDQPQLTGPKRAAKRALDLVMTGAILLVLAVPLLLVALAVKVTSPGPVLYRQPRVGKHGEVFTVLKFRSMKQRPEGAPVIDPEVAHLYQTPQDPRVTTVGRFIRRWSVDELPQLLNVLGGSMSLVGPRPLLLEEATDLLEHEERRHLTKPGITGLWQISGRKMVSWDERMRMDLWYVENWSPALDLVILARTAKAVVAGEGAY